VSVISVGVGKVLNNTPFTETGLPVVGKLDPEKSSIFHVREGHDVDRLSAAWANNGESRVSLNMPVCESMFAPSR
jgi:hypothetical protein